MFPISSGAPALVCPEAPSLPLLGMRRRAQPAWPPPWTGVDVEAPHGGSGPSRQLQEPAGPRILCRGKRVSVRLWGQVLGPGRMVQLCREKCGEGKSSRDVLRRPGPWGMGAAPLCTAAPPAPTRPVSFGPQSRLTLFNLIDGQNARLPCPPLSPGVCPDSCP